MKLLVTGASGFIGSHLTRLALAAEHEVAILALPGDPLKRLHEVLDRLTVFSGTLADVPALRPTLAEWRPEACVHLAWYAAPGSYLQAPENIPSLVSSLGVLQCLMDVGCRQFVAAGSCAEYDTERGFLREDSPTRPVTLYAAAKAAFCMVGQQMAELAGVQFAWGRVFHPYGPMEDPRRVIPAAIQALLDGKVFPATAGDQVRDYIHVEDVAAAFCLLAEKQAKGVFNIASGNPVKIRHLLELVGDNLGHSDLIQFGALPHGAWDPPFICGDISRLTALGWRPRYSLAEGVRRTVDWWRVQRTSPI